MSTSAASNLPPVYPDRAPRGTATALRAWQQEALDTYAQRRPRDFLAVATPGSGKTTFALRVAAELLADRTIAAVTVVTPTEHLKRQWAQAAERIGISLDPDFRNADGAAARDFTGVAVTYAQVAAHPALHRARTEARRTLVILDEIHHGGDALSWGDAVREAFEPAHKRLGLTGTPFRSDTNPIPFVSYERDGDGAARSAADYSYGYGRALADGVVRPVLFLAYAGEMRWRTRAGDEIAVNLGEPMTKDAVAQAWRTALDPQGEWIPQVLTAANRRLTEVRRGVPDAGGLVVATDHKSARAYSAQLGRICGEAPTVVLSDDPKASDKIAEFSTSNDRWMVAVRMVSEGVDIPRLSVGVFATSVSTPLFFEQVVGRFVRARRRGETASIFLPSVPTLLQHAAELERDRDHVLGKSTADEGMFEAVEDERSETERQDKTEEDMPFQALEASAAFDRVLYEGGEFGTSAAAGSAEEQDYLGLPGLLEPDQVATLLRKRQADQLAAQQKQQKSAPDAEKPATTHERRDELRKELNRLVGAWHHKTGKPHGAIHTELRDACGGSAVASASGEELQARIDTLRHWATGASR